MSNYRLQLLAAAICMASLPALAQVPVANSGGRDVTTTAAVSAVAPSLGANPGASAAVQRSVAQAAAEGARSSDTFRSTGANLHAEDQCIIADMFISRADPEIGQTSTFLSYTVRNLCDGAGNASGGLEIPDATFTGDPRTDDAVNLTVDLTTQGIFLQGTPLVADITWTKTDLSVSRSRGANSTRTRDPETGVVTKVAFKSRNVNTTADVTGDSNLFPTSGATGTIFWDDFENITAITEPAAQ